MKLIGKYTEVEIFLDPEHIEQECISQIYLLVNSPAFDNCKIRIMPDCHAGKGSVIGFTSTFIDKIIPNVVGVDIGCGVIAYPLGKIELDLVELDNFIRRKVPHGFGIHDRSLWDEKDAQLFLGPQFKSVIKRLDLDESKVLKSLGTLGGGKWLLPRLVQILIYS